MSDPIEPLPDETDEYEEFGNDARLAHELAAYFYEEYLEEVGYFL
jgi:hypothetical protein